MKNSLAKSTQRTYSSGKKQFFNFCEKHSLINPNGSPLPADELTILRFIGHLSKSCIASTIRVYLSAVRSLHIQEGFQDPLIRCLRIPLVLKGLRRIKSSSREPKMPITPLILYVIKGHLDLSKFEDSMLWAACGSAFYGFLRASEFTTSAEALSMNKYMSIKDLSIDDPSSPQVVFIKLRFSKTDQFGQGWVVNLARMDSDICPVAALMKYLWLRGPRDGPLFVYPDFSPLTKSKLNLKLQTIFRNSGLPGHYTLHSFRVGAASTAATLGFPDYLIKAMGRWSSEAY